MRFVRPTVRECSSRCRNARCGAIRSQQIGCSPFPLHIQRRGVSMCFPCIENAHERLSNWQRVWVCLHTPRSSRTCALVRCLMWPWHASSRCTVHRGTRQLPREMLMGPLVHDGPEWDAASPCQSQFIQILPACVQLYLSILSRRNQVPRPNQRAHNTEPWGCVGSAEHWLPHWFVDGSWWYNVLTVLDSTRLVAYKP